MDPTNTFVSDGWTRAGLTNAALLHCEADEGLALGVEHLVRVRVGGLGLMLHEVLGAEAKAF